MSAKTGLKGLIQSSHIPVSNFTLTVIGFIKVVFITITGLESELDLISLPNRTFASGGQLNPKTFKAKTMLHHREEHLALSFWYEEGRDPITPTYKKPGLLQRNRIVREVVPNITFLDGLFIVAKKEPDLDMSKNEPAMVEWTFAVDRIVSI